MENVLFKIAFPAEFHGQTAAEAAIKLHPEVKDRLEKISHIQIKTQESAMRIINKQGPLHNPADSNHCLQYICAIGLIFGELRAEHYEDETAKDIRIDALRQKMQLIESKEFSKNYLDPEKRSIGNSIQIFFKDGQSTEEISIEYPIGHRQRRGEGIPLLMKKFVDNIQYHFKNDQAQKIIQLSENKPKFLTTQVHEWINLLSKTR